MINDHKIKYLQELLRQVTLSQEGKSVFILADRSVQGTLERVIIDFGLVSGIDYSIVSSFYGIDSSSFWGNYSKNRCDQLLSIYQDILSGNACILWLGVDTNIIVPINTNYRYFLKVKRRIEDSFILQKSYYGMVPTVDTEKRIKKPVNRVYTQLTKALMCQFDQKTINHRIEMFDNRKFLLEDRGILLKIDLSNQNVVKEYRLGCNLPRGEIFWSPTNVEGDITFELPQRMFGESVEGLSLKIYNCRIVECKASKGIRLIEKLLSFDRNSDRIGEFGVGVNSYLTRLIGIMSIDEKIDGTIHLGVGNAPVRYTRNNKNNLQSFLHYDLIKEFDLDRANVKYQD